MVKCSSQPWSRKSFFSASGSFQGLMAAEVLRTQGSLVLSHKLYIVPLTLRGYSQGILWKRMQNGCKREKTGNGCKSCILGAAQTVKRKCEFGNFPLTSNYIILTERLATTDDEHCFPEQILGFYLPPGGQQ